MEFGITFFLILVGFQCLLVFLLMVWTASNSDQVKIVNTFQHHFSEEDWPYAQQLTKFVDEQRIFYEFAFVPYLSAKTYQHKGSVVKLVNIQIEEKELTESELYLWLDRLGKRHVFDATYLEWLFSYLKSFPEMIKETTQFSIAIDFSDAQYEGVIKDIAELSNAISLPCSNIEIMGNLGVGKNDAVTKKLKLLQSYGIGLNWNPFGKSISSLSSIVEYDYQSVTLSLEIVNSVDQKSTFKKFILALVELLKEKNIRIRLPVIEDKRIVEQLVHLGIHEFFYTLHSQGMTGESYIEFCQQHLQLREA